MWKRCQRRTSWRWWSSRQVQTLFAAGVRRLLAHMLRRRCNASFSKTRRARATTLPASGGCCCLETSLYEKITLCITRCTHSVARQRLLRVQYFTRLGASLSLFHRCNAFLCFCLLSLFSFKAASCLWLMRFSVLSLNHWPFLSCFLWFLFLTTLLFSTQVWISKVPQRKKKKNSERGFSHSPVRQ